MTGGELIQIEERRRCGAPPRQVWKLLYDPTRFSRWWPGWERVETAPGALTHYDARWPDYPYPSAISADHAAGRVVVSCLVSDIAHIWSLETDEGGCLVTVRIAVPAAERHRVEELAATARAALDALAAEAASPGRGRPA